MFQYLGRAQQPLGIPKLPSKKLQSVIKWLAPGPLEC